MIIIWQVYIIYVYIMIKVRYLLNGRAWNIRSNRGVYKSSSWMNDLLGPQERARKRGVESGGYLDQLGSFRVPILEMIKLLAHGFGSLVHLSVV